MTNELIVYVRNKKKNEKKQPPIGVIMARRVDDNHFSLGWSKCSKKDRFDKNVGLMIARGRTLAWDSASLPRVVENVLCEFELRASKYFKGCSLLMNKGK